MGDIRAERQELITFPCKWRRRLPALATQIDFSRQVDGLCRSLIECWIASCHAAHALGNIAMAVGAGFVGRALRLLPVALAVDHPEHSRIAVCVGLHGLRLR
jgi:hypothetical protein